MRPTGQWYYIQSYFILAIKLFSLLLERETIYYYFFFYECSWIFFLIHLCTVLHEVRVARRTKPSRFGPHSCTSSNYLALAHKMWSQLWCRNMVWTGSGGSRFLFYLLRVYGVSICMDIGHYTILCCAAHKSGRYWGFTARRFASVGRIMATSFL